jgi:hypothetical protein
MMIAGDRLPFKGMKRPSLGRSASAQPCSENHDPRHSRALAHFPDSANALLTNVTTTKSPLTRRARRR